MRPSVLPHHRTCGFPHTAVESSERSLTACSRASMKEALMFAHCVASVTPSHLGLDSAASPATAMRIHSSPCAVPQEVVAAVATPLAFRPPSRLLPQAQIAPRSRDSSSLRSACLSAGLFATTDSADFSHTLVFEISPGKVHVLSTRAVELYHRCPSVTVGFRVS